MKNQEADDARRAKQEASRAKLDALREQMYPNLGEVGPTDSVGDVARQARASLPMRTKIGGWVMVGILLLSLYAMIQSRPAEQRVVGYWVVGLGFGFFAVLIAVLWIREDLARKRRRASQSEGTSDDR